MSTSEGPNIIHVSTVNCNPSIAPPKCTFILIATMVSIEQRRRLSKLSNAIKKTVIKHIEKIAKNAHPGDMIEVYTCDHGLTDPLLIPFCDASKAATKQNRSRIKAITFHESTQCHLESSICIVFNRMLRLSTYCSEFLLFGDVSSISLSKSTLKNSIASLLAEIHTITTHVFDPTDNLLYSNEPSSQSKIRGTDPNHNHDTNRSSVRRQTSAESNAEDSSINIDLRETPNTSSNADDIRPQKVGRLVRVLARRIATMKSKIYITKSKEKLSVSRRYIARNLDQFTNKSSASLHDLSWIISVKRQNSFSSPT